MSGAQLKQLLNDATVVPITIEQYHRMIETGILEEGEPIELLDGMLVRKDRSAAGEDPMTVGHLHAWVVAQLTILLAVLANRGCHCRPQLPVSLPPDGEPEPDASIVRGSPRDYLHAHPSAADVSCVVEVSDSSLILDRSTKQRVYADAGIPQYLIVNLVDHVVEEYRGPVKGGGRYAAMQRHGQGNVVKLRLPDGSDFDLAVDHVLP
jgi:Uma2 family endonuclease